MPLYSLIVDDSSPMFQYSEGWTEGNFTDNIPTNSASYMSGTRHVTTMKGANTSLTFYGNGLSIYGTRGPGYGLFSVILDGKDQGQITASPRDKPDGATQPQELLYTKQDFGVGLHSVTIINSGDGLVDLDWVVIATGNGDPTVEAVNTTIEDSQISFSPADAWSSRSTSANNSEASFSFSGDAINVYGFIGPDYGAFKVQVDNRDPVLLNASAAETRQTELLYFTGGLKHGDHTVRITNAESAKLRLNNIISSSWSGPVQFPSDFKHISTRNVPVIAGVLSGTAVLIFWLIAIFLWFRRRRRRKLGLPAKHPKELPTKAEDFVLPPDPAIEEGLYEPGHQLYEDKEAQRKAGDMNES